jgi:hypothetical protein
MASIDDGKLYLCVDDASEEDVQRAMKAVRSVFEKAGVTAEQAIEGNMAREILIDTARPLDEMSEADARGAEALDQAYDAVRAFCAPKTWMDIGLLSELEDVEAELDCGPHDQMPARDERRAELI